MVFEKEKGRMRRVIAKLTGEWLKDELKCRWQISSKSTSPLYSNRNGDISKCFIEFLRINTYIELSDFNRALERLNILLQIGDQMVEGQRSAHGAQVCPRFRSKLAWHILEDEVYRTAYC